MPLNPLPEDGIVPHYIPPDEGDSLDHVGQHYEVNRRLNGNSSLPALVVDGPTRVGASDQRIPFSVNFNMDGTALSPDSDLVNKVGFSLAANFEGGFSGEGATEAPDPGFIFLANDYGLTGTAAGDIAGITDFWGRLTETHNRTPGSSLNIQLSFAAQAFVDEATAHSHDLTSIRAFGPTGAGTADTATSLRVDTPSIGTEKYAIFQAGNGKNLFGGSIYLSQTGNSLGGYLNIDIADAGVVGMTVLQVQGQSADLVRVMQYTGVPKFRLDKNGTIITAVTGAPADADLSDNECAFSLDTFNHKLLIKAKFGGTIYNGEVALT